MMLKYWMPLFISSGLLMSYTLSQYFPLNCSNIAEEEAKKKETKNSNNSDTLEAEAPILARTEVSNEGQELQGENWRNSSNVSSSSSETSNKRKADGPAQAKEGEQKKKKHASTSNTSAARSISPTETAHLSKWR